MFGNRQTLCLVVLRFLFQRKINLIKLPNNLGNSLIKSWICCLGAAHGQAGDDVARAGSFQKLFQACTHFLAGPVCSIINAIVKSAHDSNLAAVFPDKFRNVVSSNSTLKNINTHLDHLRNKIRSIRI